MAVVIANYCKRGKGERKLAKENIAYIQNRPGRGRERLTRTLFGASGSMGRAEAYQFITEAPKGTYYYRLKLSPDPREEDVKRDLNMQKLTRAKMKRLEMWLKTSLTWAAALHDDHTDIRHVHILAAIPRRLRTYDLEFLIREATQLSLRERRFLDRGVSRLPWQEHVLSPRLKTGKYTATRHQHAQLEQAGETRRTQGSCSCSRCHMPHSHNRQRGNHQCIACGLMLHKKKEQSLTKGQGRRLERTL
jgi:hypothetical protein